VGKPFLKIHAAIVSEPLRVRIFTGSTGGFVGTLNPQFIFVIGDFMSRFIPLVLVATASFSSMLGAQEVGRVVSSMPIIQQVAVPRQVCTQQQVATQAHKSGAGSAMGAIAGGVVGNAIGKGDGNALATAIGLIGGAILGDKIEGAPPTEMRNVQTCSTQNFYENRTIAYNVVYEFNGKQYNVQMPQDPGPTVRLQVTPMISSTQSAPPSVPYPAQNAIPPLGSAPQSF
jgi:uncharacterized protein YcfJ